MKTTLRSYVALHLFLMVYSAGGIVSKLAAGKRFLSFDFVIFYSLEVIILAFYAIGWQQFIKRMPLSVAYANKAVTVVWGCIWGMLIFHEHLTAGRVAGAMLVLLASAALAVFARNRRDAVGR